jgi:hypothetical protein
MGVSLLERKSGCVRNGLKNSRYHGHEVLMSSPPFSVNLSRQIQRVTPTRRSSCVKTDGQSTAIPSAGERWYRSHCPTFSHHSYLGSVLHGGFVLCRDLPIQSRQNRSLRLFLWRRVITFSGVYNPLSILVLAHLCMARLDSSIMHFNFGLVHLCMAKLDKTSIKLQEASKLNISASPA